MEFLFPRSYSIIDEDTEYQQYEESFPPVFPQLLVPERDNEITDSKGADAPTFS